MTQGSSKPLMWFRVAAALMVPVYLGVSSAIIGLQDSGAAAQGSWVLAACFVVGVATVCAHFVAGYRWARWTVAVLALAFACMQAWIVYASPSATGSGVGLPVVLLLGVSTLFAANAVWLLAAKEPAAFFDARRRAVTPGQTRILRVLRWSLAAIVLVGVISDVRKMIA